jgi:hypothetical protein
MTELPAIDLIGSVIAGLLTIMVLSYLVGDNPLFRIATHLFIGVAGGYAGAIAWHNVLWPGLVDPLVSGDLLSNSVAAIALTGVPWVLVLLLLFKISPATARIGSLPVALLVGVGAAVVVGGAITGTLIPQALAATESLSPSAVAPQTGETGLERMLNVTILLAGTVSTLIYFRFTAGRRTDGVGQRSRSTAAVAYGGRVFIAITFGVMYAGALAATILTLTERIQFLRDVVAGLLAG